LLVGYFFFARIGNLLPVSGNSFNPWVHLSRDNLQVSESCLVVVLGHTKTIQDGSRVLQIPLAAIPNSPVCPVTAVVRMNSLVPYLPNQSAFCYCHGQSVKVMVQS